MVWVGVYVSFVGLIRIISDLFQQIVASFTVRAQSAYAAAGAIAQEVLSSIRTVVAFGGEYKELDRSLSHSLSLSLKCLSMNFGCRYQTTLKTATKVGYKRSFFTALVTGLLQGAIFLTIALGFW